MKRYLWVVFALAPAMLFGQSENKIEGTIQSMIETHTLRVAIFRVAPQISLTAGYDSNVLTTSQLPVADYFTSVVPGVDAAVKLGHRGYFALQENLNFLYYRDLSNLNDIFTDTQGRFVTGTRKVLLELSGGYVDKKAPVNYEFDQPVQQKTSSAKVDFEFAMRAKTDLRLHADFSKSLYEIITGEPPQSAPPPDSRSTGYGLALAQDLGRLMKATVDATMGKTDFLNRPGNSTQARTSNFWNVLGGIEFNSLRLKGQARAGYGQTDSTSAGQSSFNDFLVDTNVDYLIRRRLSLGVVVQRKRSVSSFLQDNFTLSTYAGVRGSFPLAKRFFVDGKFTAGNNNYNGLPATGTDIVITKDNYQQAEGGFDFEFREGVVLRISATRLNRDSNVPSLNKDRTAYGLGLIFEPPSKSPR